jgi:prophage DNA circulation protein
MSSEWQNLTNGSFKGVPFHVAIPSRDHQYGIESEEMTLERRLQFIKRPLIDGAPVRDWGSDPETHSAVIEFFGVNHARTAEKFLQTLNEGTPGLLILPTSKKGVLAYFWKRTRTTNVHDGNAIRVTVTWVTATEVQSAGTGKATAFNVEPVSIDTGKSTLDSDVSNALSVLQNNPFLTAVRTFESTLSKARSAVNAVLSIEEGVRNKVASLQADLAGTLSLIKSATDEIHSIFSPSAIAAAKSAISNKSLGTNNETGQTVTDFSEPDTIPAQTDPLAPPAVQPSVSIPTNNLNSISGVKNFGDAVVAVLTATRDDLSDNSSGRTEDVIRNLTATLNSFSAYIQAVVGAPPLSFTVPVDMSLGEALFLNGIDLSELRTIHRQNPQVDDPFVVPKGTVLLL